MSRSVAFVSLTAAITLILFGVFHGASADPPDSGAQQQIREALRGNAGQQETSDGVLDDVLQVIKGRGSILNGSSLDRVSSAAVGDAPPGSSVSARSHAAEQLLKAARLLEKAELLDERRADLIRRMRVEAAKLLSE